MVTAVTMSLPLPFEATAPVAAVIAVPSVTLLALRAVPSVGAVLFAPEIMRVSEASPLPIAKFHVEALPALVTFGIVTLVFPVTLGIEVVTSLLAVFVTFDTLSVPSVGVIEVVTRFFPVSAVTDFTNVSVVGLA